MPSLWNNSRKVIFSREEVDAFRARWPGCKLRSRSYWFEFDAGGNLIDSDVPEHDDGPEALALSQDAADYLTQETLDRAGEVLPVYTMGKADPVGYVAAAGPATESPAYPFFVRVSIHTGALIYIPFSFESVARDYAARHGGDFMTAEERQQADGLAAQAAGVPWWENPYPSGSREAYAWDLGHTAGRRAKK